jgi:hypothetical protein
MGYRYDTKVLPENQKDAHLQDLVVDGRNLSWKETGNEGFSYTTWLLTETCGGFLYTKKLFIILHR